MSKLEKDTTVTTKEGVTDADLSNAYDAMKGGDIEEEEIVEVKDKEESLPSKIEEDWESLPETQADRSRLGRKVQRYEQEMAEIKDMFKTFLEVNQARQPVYSPTEPEEDELPEFISTPQDVEKILEARDKKKAKEEETKQQEQKVYESRYINTFFSFAEDDPDHFDEIEEIMQSKFNIRHSNNPVVDARLNFLEARDVFYRKNKVKPNVKGGNSSLATGFNIQTNTPLVETSIKLSPLAEEFVRKTGMKEESVRAALKDQ